MDDSSRDPATGLLTRESFLREVREAQQLLPDRLRRGCLLILQFPLLRNLSAANDDPDACDDAMCHLLAIVETRVRSRDTLGRIANHSLCVLLKGCKEDNAIVVADQYVALLRDIVLQSGDQQLPMGLRYRIVSLDARGNRPRQGVSRLIKARPVTDPLMLAKEIEVAGNRVDLMSSKVVSLNAARAIKSQESSATPPGDFTDQQSNSVVEIGEQNNAHAWRLRPGMLISRMPLVCCYRLQPISVEKNALALHQSDLFASILNALALHERETRPVMESQLILPVQAGQITSGFPQWVSARCKQMRVAPSDICLSISVQSLSNELNRIAAELRLLNRYGVRLMLEDVGSSSQFRMMRNVANFDYLHISGRTLSDSLKHVSERMSLESIIAEAKVQHCEISAGGIDTEAKLKHAAKMNIEIGFGRQCGPSIAFPGQAWIAREDLAN